jgi:hypothetical protein
MQRTIVPARKYFSEALSPGVLLERFHPGGKDGPNGEVLSNTRGGQTWSEMFLLGDQSDAFQMLVPDIRLPANQLWPLHWHDCWTVVLILEGQCLIGDWWMQPGDVFITIGPQGCRMFEIFAKAHLARGGYAPEYHDHPTLVGTQAVFTARSSLNERNDGRQILPCDGVRGLTKTRLSSGAQWELGDPGDAERGVIKDTRLAANERIAAHRHEDWHAIIMLGGSLHVAGKTLEKDSYLVIRPQSQVDELQAGPQGAQLLELSRTARAL